MEDKDILNDNRLMFPVDYVIKLVNYWNILTDESDSRWSFSYDEHGNGFASIECYCTGYYQGDLQLPEITNFGDSTREVFLQEFGQSPVDCEFCANKRWEQWGEEKINCQHCNSDGALEYTNLEG